MSRRCSKYHGFSLIELLVSTAIISIILILAASMLDRSTDSYGQIHASIASDREARSAITQLTSDLSNASFHKDGLFEQSAKTWPVDRLGFLSLKPVDSQTPATCIGDGCAVNYYIKDLKIGGKVVRCLMRGFRESNDTFAALRSGSVSSLFQQRENLDEPMAFGVISFEARPKTKDVQGKWLDWATNDKVSPQAIEIKLVIVRQEMMIRLNDSRDWDGTTAVGETLGSAAESSHNKNLEVYQATLRFGNHEM
jgi:prepilin-type N-terminal cleavage/methylation domain-containing protein